MPVSSAKENHGIVMKPAPIMEEEEIEEEEMEDQEQTKKKKDLQQTQKPFAWAGEESVGTRQRDTQSAKGRSRRRAWRREGEEDWARRRGEGRK